MKKELSHMMLELQNVRMKPSNVRNKIREPPNVTKELLHVMLELQCEDETVKCKKKKVREPLNVIKELSHVMLKLHNVRMKPSNVRKKNKRTT